MENRNEFREMFVLNLDNSSIFWISLVLFFIIVLFFFAGFFIGRKIMQNHAGPEQTVRTSNLYESAKPIANTNDNFEFYHVLNEEKLTKADITHSIPRSKLEKRKIASVPKEKPIVVEHKFPKKQTKIEKTKKTYVKKSVKRVRATSYSKKTPITTGLTHRKTHKTHPYAVQVSSCLNSAAAQSVKGQLNKKGFPAYIVRAKINHKLFYRIRVGPFSSKQAALKSLRRLRALSNYSGSYICR